MSTNNQEWAEAAANQAITTEMLDQLVTDMRQKREDYESAKEFSTTKYKVFAEAEGKLIEAMNQAGKKKYVVDGVGTVFFVEKLVVPTPKTIEDKMAFFDFIKQNYGENFLNDKLSVHHQVLQKIYNEAHKEAIDKGVGAEFTVPGLEAPTKMVNLNFRKEKGS
jgi:hypothetical protein